MTSLCVTIPTRNRPEKLRKCLLALQEAREHILFDVHVCDSSNSRELVADVKKVSEEFKFAHYHFHTGHNAAAARNFCATVADAELIVNVDDDIYVTPHSVKLLYDAYTGAQGCRIVAGSVAWGDDWSVPVVMRPIGYARKARTGEQPSFVVGAFFIYSKCLAQALPWNEQIRTSEDRFMGALWRSKNVQMLFEPQARAFHDHQHTFYDVTHQESHIYANMFDAIIANPSLYRALAYQFIGFAAGAKVYFRKPDTALKYLWAWSKGNYKFIADWRYLKKYTERSVPHTP